tara:strand:+ start:13 stop:846 length:834 start_codon:yes stop_codon:yes gene_type:complete
MKVIVENRKVRIDDLVVGDVFSFEDNYNEKIQPIKDKYIFDTLGLFDSSVYNEIYDVDLTSYRARVVAKPSWDKIYIKLVDSDVKYKKVGTKTWKVGSTKELLKSDEVDHRGDVLLDVPFNFVLHNRDYGSLNLITRLSEHDILEETIDVNQLGVGEMKIQSFNVHTNEVQMDFKATLFGHVDNEPHQNELEPLNSVPYLIDIDSGMIWEYDLNDEVNDTSLSPIYDIYAWSNGELDREYVNTQDVKWWGSLDEDDKDIVASLYEDWKERKMLDKKS